MRQAALEGEEWLLGIAVLTVLPDGILHGLPGERLLQLHGEDGQPVEEERHVQRVVRPGAVAQLADDREAVRFVEPLRLFVEARDRPEVREAEGLPVTLYPVAQEVQRSPLDHLRGEA